MEALIQNKRSTQFSINRTVNPGDAGTRIYPSQGVIAVCSIESSTKFPAFIITKSVFYSLLGKLNDFEKMTENWDGYGALKPSKNAISQARDFIMNSIHLELPFYFVSPSVNGEIILEFKKDSKSAEIYFNEESDPELLLFDGLNCVAEGLNLNVSTLIDFFQFG